MTRTPHAYDDEMPKKKKRAGVLTWIMFGMVILGLGGFGVQQFGGTITTIGSVGQRDIPLQDYARGLRAQIVSLQQQAGGNVDFALIQALGMDRQVLSQVVNNTALANEADRLGLSAGDAGVAAEIAARPDFKGVDGSFDKEGYLQLLDRNGLRPSEFENTVRDDLARGMLRNAVSGGVVAPAAVVERLNAWQNETRSVAWLALQESDLPAPVADPDEAAVKSWYEARIADFTRPAGKRIRFVALTAEAAGAAAPIEEAAVRALYDKRADQYLIPEKRLVERLVYPDQAAADAARARLDAGARFEDLVAERGLTLEDVDLGDVTKGELGAAGEAVFALTAPGVVGPLASDLGPALFRMNVILPAQETAYDAVKADLEAELRREAGADLVAEKVDAVDDLLAGGGSLEELAEFLGSKVEVTDFAPGAEDNLPLASQGGFAREAGRISSESFPEAVVLEDGSLIAMEWVEDLPPSPRPLETVRDKVAEAAMADAVAKALLARAEAIVAEVAAGADLAGYGTLVREAKLPRGGAMDGAPAETAKRAFETAPGTRIALAGGGLVGVLAVEAVTAVDPALPETKDDLDLLGQAFRQSIAADVFQLYAKSITDAAEVELDPAAINAVNSQIMTQ